MLRACDPMCCRLQPYVLQGAFLLCCGAAMQTYEPPAAAPIQTPRTRCTRGRPLRRLQVAACALDAALSGRAEVRQLQLTLQLQLRLQLQRRQLRQRQQPTATATATACAHTHTHTHTHTQIRTHTHIHIHMLYLALRTHYIYICTYMQVVPGLLPRLYVGLADRQLLPVSLTRRLAALCFADTPQFARSHHNPHTVP